jgi:hypothetical protein
MADAETQQPITPAAVRAQLQELTGLTLRGPITRQISPTGAEEFGMSLGQQLLVAERNPQGWVVRLIGHAREVVNVWRTTPMTTHRNAAAALAVILGNEGVEGEVIFVVERLDLAANIARKFFQTEAGPVWVHTRQEDEEIEFVVEFADDGRVLRFIQAEGVLNLANVAHLDAVPF